VPRKTPAGVAVAAAIGAAILASAAIAATPAWATKANAVCTAWGKKGIAAVGTNPPLKTPAQKYSFMLEIRPIEVGLLHGLLAIRLPRPPGANHALSLAESDIGELTAAISAYHSGHRTAFSRDWRLWRADSRAGHAFASIGATVCE
jgi:hypothetical protein